MKKVVVEQSTKHFCPSRHELEMVDDIAMKDKVIIKPIFFTETNTGAVASNHMDIKEWNFLARELEYCMNMNADIKTL